MHDFLNMWGWTAAAKKTEYTFCSTVLLYWTKSKSIDIGKQE